MEKIKKILIVSLETDFPVFFEDEGIAFQEIAVCQSSLGMAFLRPWIAEVQVNHLNLPRCEYIKNFTDIPKDQTYIVERRFFFRYFLCGIVKTPSCTSIPM